MKTFTKRYPGKTQVIIESLDEGFLTHFSAPEISGAEGHEIFLEILEQTERLMEIEILLRSPSISDNDASVLKEEGMRLFEKLYEAPK